MITFNISIIFSLYLLIKTVIYKQAHLSKLYLYFKNITGVVPSAKGESRIFTEPLLNLISR